MTKLVEELRMYASMSNHPDLLIDAADEITALRDKNARLRAALRPFAEAASKYDPAEGDDELPVWDWSPTTGMLRKARAALGGE